MSDNPETLNDLQDELREEYEFRKLKGLVRGKYADESLKPSRMAKLAGDVAAAFPDDASVNQALRTYLREHPLFQKVD